MHGALYAGWTPKVSMVLLCPTSTLPVRILTNTLTIRLHFDRGLSYSIGETDENLSYSFINISLVISVLRYLL